MGRHEKARNLLEQEPGQGREFVSVSRNSILAGGRADCHHQETADGYLGFFGTKSTLILLCASLDARVDPATMAILMALPDVIGGAP